MQMKQPDVALSARAARHRDDAVLVQNPGLVRALERDRREPFLRPVRIDAGLNHLDLDLVLGLVVHLDGAMPRAAVVVPGVDVLEKVRRRDRRPRRDRPRSRCRRARSARRHAATVPRCCADAALPAAERSADRGKVANRMRMRSSAERTSVSETQTDRDAPSEVGPADDTTSTQNRYVVANWNCRPGKTLAPPVCWPNLRVPDQADVAARERGSGC